MVLVGGRSGKIYGLFVVDFSLEYGACGSTSADEELLRIRATYVSHDAQLL
ncbi:hypothetical protein HanRHA438_Chr09g0405561 [Helianthus annuus]|nr:hypothetical protein HanIR_Chr09g0424491 [Helianthus annuus]KAJ0888753.1 hypothetical protein HanRHA438_Chr09g0405561 [Helianthus annuus]KAJ0893608.1 hypothetical protein HanPSC8_Chr09g0379681 [Helianthus annuus]